MLNLSQSTNQPLSSAETPLPSFRPLPCILPNPSSHLISEYLLRMAACRVSIMLVAASADVSCSGSEDTDVQVNVDGYWCEMCSLWRLCALFQSTDCRNRRCVSAPDKETGDIFHSALTNGYDHCQVPARTGVIAVFVERGFIDHPRSSVVYFGPVCMSGKRVDVGSSFSHVRYISREYR